MVETIINKGTYFLSELDGARLKNTFADDRLKKFHVRKDSPIIQLPDNRIEKLSDDAIDDDDDPPPPSDVAMNRDEDLISPD